ncbi:MAG: ComF family protein [Rubrobacteraceae bacterium]
MRTELYLGALADLFYPQRCVGCRGRASDVLCRDCFEALPWIGEPACRRCGLPTAFEVLVCEECKNVDFGFESARAPLRYEGVGKRIVHALKYSGYLRVVERLMAPMMREAVTADFDLIVPVPLHPYRLRRRGFNQAGLMARGLADKIKKPVSDRLEAVRITRDQVELSAAERRSNVEGAFRARGAVRGRVLLVDDVFTTGATLSAGSAELRRAGAAEVYALSLCRTC